MAEPRIGYQRGTVRERGASRGLKGYFVTHSWLTRAPGRVGKASFCLRREASDVLLAAHAGLESGQGLEKELSHSVRLLITS